MPNKKVKFAKSKIDSDIESDTDTETDISSDNKLILTYDKVIPDSDLDHIINKLKVFVKTLTVPKILQLNPYEKLIPFNFWYYHHMYTIKDHFANGQHIRSRYFNGIMVTPLISTDNLNLVQFKTFKESLSLYQPFYPESFYNVWEILQQEHVPICCTKRVLQIGKENRFGSIEAIMLYFEKNQLSYQSNIYHGWLAGKEMYNSVDGFYTIMAPKINYLEQAYKIKFLLSTTELITYDLICIDANHQLENIFEWSQEELDLHANLFYFLTSLNHLSKNGCLLIRLNMIGNPSWSFLMELANIFFTEYTFLRPTTTNPLNPEIYLFLTRFDKDRIKFSIRQSLFKNLYRQKLHHVLNLNPADYFEESKHAIITKYQKSVAIWIKSVSGIINNTDFGPKNKIPDTVLINEWHESNDLLQVRHTNILNSLDFNKKIRLFLRVSNQKFVLKPAVPEKLYEKQFYRKLIKKKADLNYHKRVMDTKPSYIFMSDSYFPDKYTYLIPWEQLTNRIDLYKNLKNIIRHTYGAELATNAWIKMFEIFSTYPNLLPIKNFKSNATFNGTLKTFHLCEAPGAFVSATNHYLSGKGIKWEWYAQTLKPSHCTIALDDHYGLMAAYPDRWLFGDDMDQSGDITHSRIIKSYAKNSLLSNIDFMTADAGLQCNPNELNEQETHLAKINMGQIVCILACLSIDKCAIFKTFLPMTEPLTISMMYLVTQLFRSVSLIKPVASHNYNSEVYVLLEGYRGIKPTLLEMLYDILDDPKMTSKTFLFDENDKIFFDSYVDGVTFLIDRQIQCLNRNYYYYYHMDQIQQLNDISDYHTNQWFDANPIPRLERNLI